MIFGNEQSSFFIGYRIFFSVMLISSSRCCSNYMERFGWFFFFFLFVVASLKVLFLKINILLCDYIRFSFLISL